MKADGIREMTIKEMRNSKKELKEELFNLRFQHEIGQLENSQTIRKTKRNIARVETIIAEITKKS